MRPNRPAPIRRRRAWRRRTLAIALGFASALHALLILILVLPGPPERARGPLRVVPLPPSVPARPPAAERSATGPAPRSPSTARPSEPAGFADAGGPPAVAAPVPTPDAPEGETMPETTLRDLARPTLPLEAGPDGPRRRVSSTTAGVLARMRAESLVNARLAALPGAGRPAPRGAVTLAGGGVSIAIPWPGFLPADRMDGAWRRERCAGEDDGEADKAGEAEARRGRCG